jgi:hypothetical protein
MLHTTAMRIAIGAFVGAIAGGLLGLAPTYASYYLLDVPNNPGPHGSGALVGAVFMICVPGGVVAGLVLGIIAGGLTDPRNKRRPK